MLAWSLVHGFSSLAVEGMLPLEAGAAVLDLFGRLVLTDEGFATVRAEVAATSAGVLDEPPSDADASSSAPAWPASSPPRSSPTPAAG